MKVNMPDDGVEEIEESRFLFADLAGSEGDTALTPKFISQYPADVVLTRKLEAGFSSYSYLNLYYHIGHLLIDRV